MTNKGTVAMQVRIPKLIHEKLERFWLGKKPYVSRNALIVEAIDEKISGAGTNWTRSLASTQCGKDFFRVYHSLSEQSQEALFHVAKSFSNLERGGI